VRKIMIATVQASTLFGSEIWWRRQKHREEDIQKLLNRTARAITGCMKSTPIAPLIAEASVLPAETILNDRLRKYTNGLLALPEGHQAKNILSATLTNGPQETSDPEFTPTRRRTNGADLGTRLTKSVQTAIGENNGVETITDSPISEKGNVTIKDRDAAANDGKRASSTTGSIFTDGSTVDSGYTGCSVVWRQTNREWRKERYNLGRRKEIYDAELYTIAEAVSLAYNRNIRTPDDVKTIHIYSDSTAALKRLKDPNPSPSQWLIKKIAEMETMIEDPGHRAEYHWIPGHMDIKGNEIADKAAKRQLHIRFRNIREEYPSKSNSPQSPT
jgi:ribonuclease HI